MHARYYRNPFRRSVTVDTKDDANNYNAGAEGVPSDVGILLRNLIVGPPKGAERIMLKVSLDKDGTSDEIAAIIREREDQIKRGNQNNETPPKTERVINVVEDIDSGNDSNQQFIAGNGDPNSKADGRQSKEPNKTVSDPNNNKAAAIENNNKKGDVPKSDGKAAESDTASKPTANNSKSADNFNAGEINANAGNDIIKNTNNNANEAIANNSANNNKQQQQQQENGGSGRNVFAINGAAAENSGSGSQSNEGPNADGNSASVERSTRNAKKPEGNNAGKSMFAGYVVTMTIHPAENLRN